MNYLDQSVSFTNVDIEDFLNKNKNNITKFEVVDNYYLKIHLNDSTYINLEPEYGGIYFFHRSK